jgi:hypothetical protein
MGMRSDRIVEAGDIENETLLELFEGLIAATVQIFLFEILEEALYNSVNLQDALAYLNIFCLSPRKHRTDVLVIVLRLTFKTRRRMEMECCPASVWTAANLCLSVA